MATFAVEGFGAIAQDHISRNVASNFYPKITFVAALAAFTLTRNKKTALNIGRPEGEILTGKAISPAEVLSLEDFNSYKPRIQGFETSNSKWMGKYDTKPVVANPTTRSHGQATQFAAMFNRCRLSTPILIQHEDKKRALQKGTKAGMGIEMSRIIDEATEVAYQEHTKNLADKILNGNPADQTADPWSEPLGVFEAIKTNNVYGNVDRTITANAVWKAQVDSSLKAVNLTTILDDANIRKGLRTFGGGVDLVITGGDIYETFKAQAQAQNAQVVTNGLPDMLKYGVKKEVIQKDNALIMYDTAWPANTVSTFTMQTWRLAIRPGLNMAVLPFFDLSRTGVGAMEADQGYIETEFIFSCDNPWLNVNYTAIGT